MNDTESGRNMTRQCPQCGAPLSPGALEGLCPACLLHQGATADTATHTEVIPFQPPDVAEVARLFPQLQILAFIGKGGMGAVYKARQPALDRLVALKLLPPQVAGGPGFAERFAREARALARLNHPNIVAVYEFGQVDGLPFFLMEFVDGLNLRELERAGKLSPREALQIVPQICEALQFAHDEGIVHRDIKPENILLDKKGRVKIADFGIAKIMGAGVSDPATAPNPGLGASAAPGTEPSRLTEEGKIVGTPNYMAPEQVETPQSVDHRADIFSLGVVFYEMLTGELPLGKFTPPSSRARGVTVDVRLDEVVLRALEREPERRYQQASQVRTAVQNITGYPGQPQPAFPQSGFEYRSRATLFGLPLLHMATGGDPVTGRPRVARGIIAIGGIAQGVLAFGGVAMGGLTFGGVSLGVIALGGCALGAASFGGLAIALLAAFGGLAIAPIAVGGGAVGYLAFGGGVLAVHPFGGNASDEVARHFFGSWARQSMASANVVFMVLLALVLSIVIGVPFWLRRKMLAESGNSSRQPFPSPSHGMDREKPAPTALAFAAMIFAGLAGVLGVVTICMFPQPPDILVWSILVSALTGIALGIGSRKTALGRSAIVTGVINTTIWLIIAAVFLLRGNDAAFIKSDYIGQTWFPNGDSIEITSVERSNDQMTVKGHYNLVSSDNALLALHITSSINSGMPQDSSQQTNISKGHGDFELTHSHLVPGLPHISMYAGGRDFASLYFGTQSEALEESKAGWITNSSPTTQATPVGNTATFTVSATGTQPLSYQWYFAGTNTSAETWSPLILSGQKPDLRKILDDAKESMNQGHYEEALQQYIWYQNHEPEFGDSYQNIVRITSFLSDWHELGRRYPKAMQELIEIRDRETREITEGRGYSDLLVDVQAINHELQDDDATYDLFKTIREKDPQLAGQSYFFLEDLLVSKGEYQWCYVHMGDPQVRFDQIHQNLEMQIDNANRMADIQQKNAQQRAEWDQQHGITNTRIFRFPDAAAGQNKVAREAFVGKTRQLIEILIATGHTADAENIRDQAVKILDDPRLQSAITDAQKAIQSKHEQNTN
ncbi:MAG TPA: protein kinase [Verrucomicrobiae bacterium]|nr:protein kinase [Verrucomicrobiae bacterium]